MVELRCVRELEDVWFVFPFFWDLDVFPEIWRDGSDEVADSEVFALVE